MVKPNWHIFEAKFEEASPYKFEWFCYLLFCREFKKEKGIPGYINQSRIEKDPIIIGNRVIGFQSKFWSDSLTKHKKEIIEELKKIKRDYPNLNELYWYAPTDFGQMSKAKNEIKKQAEDLGIELVWRTKPYFESEDVCLANEDISSYFFELNGTFVDNLLLNNIGKSKKELTVLGKIETKKQRVFNIETYTPKYPNAYPLVDNIRQNHELYVDTKIYQKALEKIKKTRLLFITGDPGTGKTYTSEMLALDFLKNDYEVLYSKSHDYDEITAITSQILNNPKDPLLIYIDDCLGQTYLDLKSNQENELKRLISTVRINKDKFLVLNSRAVILGDVLNHETELKDTLNGLYEKEQIISTNDLSMYDKAKILYKHLLVKSSITNIHYKLIKQNDNYLEIVKHKNYNPRIIEFITTKKIIKTIDYSNYMDFVFNSLDNPNKIWEIEYFENLSDFDRLLITSIYSLTGTTISESICYKIFDEQFKIRNYDGDSKTAFNTSIERLSDSMIRIRIEANNYRTLGIANPSINDFIENNVMYNDSPEATLYKNQIKFRVQIERLYGKDSEEILVKKVKDESILSLIYDNNNIKIIEIAKIIINNRIKSKKYIDIVHKYIELLSIKNSTFFGLDYKGFVECIRTNYELSNFYNLYSISQTNFETIIGRVPIEEIYEIIKDEHLNKVFNLKNSITQCFSNCIEFQDLDFKYQDEIDDLISKSSWIIEDYSDGYAIPNKYEVEKINNKICEKIIQDIRDEIELNFSEQSVIDDLIVGLNNVWFDFSDSIRELVSTIPDPDYMEQDENKDEIDKIRNIFSKDNIK